MRKPLTDKHKTFVTTRLPDLQASGDKSTDLQASPDGYHNTNTFFECKEGVREAWILN